MAGQENYQDMVQAVVNDLKSRDFRAIAAKMEEMDLAEPDGYFQTSSQKWFYPDIQARSGDKLFIYEVETEGSLEAPETREKIEVFTNAAVKANGKFLLVVPEELRDRAMRLLRELGAEWAEVVGISRGRAV